MLCFQGGTVEQPREPDVVGKRIKRIRELRGLTIRQLSQQSGVPSSTLSFVESGVRAGAGLSLATGRKLAETLGVTLDWLSGVYRDEEREGQVWPPGMAHAWQPTIPDGADVLAMTPQR